VRPVSAQPRMRAREVGMVLRPKPTRPARSAPIARRIALRLVQQLDYTGCGIACVAMVAGVTYEQAKVAVKSRPNRAGNSTYYADLKWALDRFGVAYEMNGRRGFRFPGWEEMPRRAILAVECEPPWPGNWHWVVYDTSRNGAVVLDPSRNRVRKDFDRIQVKSYMGIIPG
jgi:ABC-type bacteriocin/lantibiotic exporter with double-glycine peptidase domain